MELEKCRMEFAEALEKKRVEIAQLRIEDVLRDYGLTSLGHDLVRSPPLGGKGGELKDVYKRKGMDYLSGKERLRENLIILWGWWSPWKRRLEEKLKDYKGRLDVAEEFINKIVGEKEKLQAEYDEIALTFQVRIKELKEKLPIEAMSDDGEALVNLYNAVEPEDKNLLLVEAFIIGDFVLDDLTFPVNMVMGSVHLRAFMSMLQNEHWLVFMEIHEYYLEEFGGANAYLGKWKASMVEWQSQKQ
eukprot:Gb_22811 [translate_table: standard]